MKNKIMRCIAVWLLLAPVLGTVSVTAAVPLRFIGEFYGAFVTWDEGGIEIIAPTDNGAKPVVTAPPTAADATVSTPPMTAEVTSIAGTGSHGAQDGLSAQFNLPGALFGVDGGYLLVADTYNNLIRAIDKHGHVARIAGSVLTPDDFGFPRGALRDGEVIYSRFNRPTDGAVDSRGWFFIADSLNHIIRVIVGGNVFTYAGSRVYGHADGSPEEARFNRPTALAIGPCGGLFITDTFNHVIRRIDPQGYVTTVAGTPGVYGHRDGEASAAVFNSPMGIAVNDDGTMFIADTGNHKIRKIQDGYVSTLAGALIFPEDVAWYDDIDADFDHEPLGGFADGGEALFNAPVGLALWGNALLVADSVNHRIRAVLTCGYTLTLAGTGEPDHADGLLLYAAFHLPRGVLVQGDTLYIADTGNNMIRMLPLYAAMFEIEGADKNAY